MRTEADLGCVQTFAHAQGEGWSVPALPAMDSDRTMVLVFGAPEYMDHPGAIRELAASYPRSHVMGCSTSGEIHGRFVNDGSLSVAVMRFAHTGLACASAPVRSAEDSVAAGVSIARQLENPGLRGVLVLSDGLRVNGSELVEGINSVLGDSVIVTGGFAGDGDRFRRTWVLRGGCPCEGWVSAIGLYGDKVRIGHGSGGGWDCFGPERRVTRSEGKVVFELDGRPALPLYKQYLGERANELPASALLFPLSLRRDSADQKRLVRAVLSVDEAREALVFGGDVPQGYLGQLMYANTERLIEGAARSASMAARGGCGEPSLTIAISCVGRRLVLGQRVEEEIESVADALAPGAQQVGFYSYGEISPFASGHCDLHNQTMTLTTYAES